MKLRLFNVKFNVGHAGGLGSNSSTRWTVIQKRVKSKDKRSVVMSMEVSFPQNSLPSSHLPQLCAKFYSHQRREQPRLELVMPLRPWISFMTGLSVFLSLPSVDSEQLQATTICTSDILTLPSHVMYIWYFSSTSTHVDAYRTDLTSLSCFHLSSLHSTTLSTQDRLLKLYYYTSRRINCESGCFKSHLSSAPRKLVLYLPQTNVQFTISLKRENMGKSSVGVLESF